MAKTIKFSDCLADYNALMQDIEARRFAPIYLLMGDEGYFIDAICDRLSASILNEAERAFNQLTVYGLDSNAGAIVNLCRHKKVYFVTFVSVLSIVSLSCGSSVYSVTVIEYVV